jgi:hypothetical protein
MKGKTSALNSTYVIDGVTMELTPAEILDNCLHQPQGDVKHGHAISKSSPEADFEQIVDETTDPAPAVDPEEGLNVEECLSNVLPLLDSLHECPVCYSAPYTKSMIAKALIDCLWMHGHFKLTDLLMTARWKWLTKPVGNMTSFYSSVEAASEYIQGLGIELKDYSFKESDKACCVDFKVGTISRNSNNEYDDEEIYDLSGNDPFGSEHPSIGTHRAIPSKLAADPDSWLIYVPFDSCDFRLGNSLLSKALEKNIDLFPEIGDADYLVDCFEVVREFVEDKIAISAISVAEGGLLTALKLMCSDTVGAAIDISGIMNSYDEKNELRVLFSEVPGIIMQIRDADYDYIDAEFLLQDVAYYPIGHPIPNKDNIDVKTVRSPKISDILQSLLNSQTTEGED